MPVQQPDLQCILQKLNATSDIWFAVDIFNSQLEQMTQSLCLQVPDAMKDRSCSYRNLQRWSGACMQASPDAAAICAHRIAAAVWP